MTVLTQRDFETAAGQEKIIKSIHQLQAKLHKVELELHKLQHKDELIDQEFQGPEAY